MEQSRTREIELAYPFTGRWLVQNSPADRVPSHGTIRFASTYAIDFVPVDAAGRTAPVTLATWFLPEQPERFPGYGRPLLAPVDGTVIDAADGVPDHSAYRGLPSVSYALGQRRRAAEGWPSLAGNHVLLQRDDGVFVALCHLQNDSLSVRVGRRVQIGDPIARCGNTGNSTEPHVHLQAFTGARPDDAIPVRMVFPGPEPRNGTIIEA